MSTDPVNSQSALPTNISNLDVIKLIKSTTREEYDSRLSQFITFLNSRIRPEFENITDSPYSNAELGAILNQLSQQILVNSLEIQTLHRLNALLIFELIEQGIKIESQELINELQQYLDGNSRS